MYISKRKKIIWTIISALILGAIALAVLLPRQGEVRDAGGTMTIICPVRSTSWERHLKVHAR